MDNTFLNMQTDKEIDLRIIFRIIRRGKLFILIFTFLSSIFGATYSFNKPNLWEGSFDIVLESDENKNDPTSAILNTLQLDLGSRKKGLETQVSILKSSSVLKPVYLFALSHKNKIGEKVDKWAYEKWVRKYLEVKLIENTQILQIKYKDTDREFIKPVLVNFMDWYAKRHKKKPHHFILEVHMQYQNYMGIG